MSLQATSKISVLYRMTICENYDNAYEVRVSMCVSKSIEEKQIIKLHTNMARILDMNSTPMSYMKF